MNYVPFGEGRYKNCVTSSFEHYTVIKKKKVDEHELLEKDLQNKSSREKSGEQSSTLPFCSALCFECVCVCVCVHVHACS